MIENSCAFTGHRPHKFPWGYDEADRRCIQLKDLLARQVRILADSGITDYYSGMADGSDIWLSQIVIDQRGRNPGIRLHCVLPCEGQSAKWSLPARERYAAVLSHADSVDYVSRAYYNGCMLDRNRRLAASAAILLAVYNGEPRGGTAATIRYARQLGRRLIMIDPVTLGISRG